jgi:hypothetical protein
MSVIPLRRESWLPPSTVVGSTETVTFNDLARAYLEDFALQRYRSMSTARPRVGHLRGFFDGWLVTTITTESIRRYQRHRREQGAEAATINRETSILSRMFHLAVHSGKLEHMPLFPKRLEEIPHVRDSLNTRNT